MDDGSDFSLCLVPVWNNTALYHTQIQAVLIYEFSRFPFLFVYLQVTDLLVSIKYLVSPPWREEGDKYTGDLRLVNVGTH